MLNRRGQRAKQNHLVWHPLAHEQWFHEHLHFWRLGFAPTYDRREVTSELGALFDEFGIDSFAVYELFGPHDLLLRVWVPYSCHFADLEARLAGLSVGTWSCDHFDVHEIESHWIWSSDPERPNPIGTVQAGILAEGPEQRELAALNDASWSQGLLDKYRQMNLVRSCRPGPGLKVISVVTRPPEGMQAKALTHLRDQLLATLRTACDSRLLTQPSMYRGDGFASFMIMGRLRPSNILRYTNALTEEMNQFALAGVYLARTYSYLTTLPRLVLFRERAPIDENQPQTPSAADLLLQHEDQHLEIKGSAFLDIEAWTAGTPRYSKEIALRGVVKAVVGLLNSGGGEIVIGALEAKQADRAGQRPARLASCPEWGDYLLVGVQEEWLEGARSGRVARDWDWFHRKLVRTLKDHIRPQATQWIHIAEDRVDETRVARISVEVPSPRDGRWWYLVPGDRLYVRQGNMTEELCGPDADEYKKSR